MDLDHETVSAESRWGGGMAAAGLVDAPGWTLSAGISRGARPGAGFRRPVPEPGTVRRGDPAADTPLWLRRGDPVQRHPDAALGAGSRAGIQGRRRPVPPRTAG